MQSLSSDDPHLSVDSEGNYPRKEFNWDTDNTGSGKGGSVDSSNRNGTEMASVGGGGSTGAVTTCRNSVQGKVLLADDRGEWCGGEEGGGKWRDEGECWER